MMVRTYTDIPLSFEEVDRRIADGLGDFLPTASEHAAEVERALEMEVGFGAGMTRISANVKAHLGTPAHVDGLTLIPVSWSPTGGHGLLPDLDGDLELAAMGPHHTQLALSASYQPPAGLAGRFADKALLHRIAEATLRDLLNRITTSVLTSAVRPPAGTAV